MSKSATFSGAGEHPRRAGRGALMKVRTDKPIKVTAKMNRDLDNVMRQIFMGQSQETLQEFDVLVSKEGLEGAMRTWASQRAPEPAWEHTLFVALIWSRDKSDTKVAVDLAVRHGVKMEVLKEIAGPAINWFENLQVTVLKVPENVVA